MAIKFKLLAALLGCIFLYLPQAASADGFIVIHDPAPMPISMPVPPRYAFAPLEVRYHHVKVSITDQIAVTEVDQSFYNPNDSRLEGTYMFPIPAGAQIDKFSMDINGKFMDAELLDADKARAIYEDIVRRMKDPALLEYAGQSMFKLRIFPIEPRSEKRIRLKYSQLLKNDSGLVQYLYPLNTEKFSSQPLREVSVRIELTSSKPIKTLYSPSHKVEVNRPAETKAVIGYEASNITPDTDFSVFFSADTGSDLGMNVLTFNDGGDSEGGYFLLLASPSSVMVEDQAIEKDVVFVIDTSGSMAEQNRLEQAKRALRFCIQNLNSKDRFEVVRFSTEAEPLFGKLAENSSDNSKKALSFVDSLKPIGGTAIEEALLKAVSPAKDRSDKSRPYFVVFLTDGRPTIGLINEEEIVRKVTPEIQGQTIRIFGLGVGTELDVHLLDKLAENTRGTTDYVFPNEDIEIKLSNFYSKLSAPLLTNPKLSFSGPVNFHKVQPSVLPDLFKGQQLVVTGRYTGKGDAAIKLEGEIQGSKRSFTSEAKFQTNAPEHRFVSQLWATRRVGYLLDQIRLHGENSELRDEVVQLARRYGIVTPYTAYLIVEDEAQRNIPAEARVFAPVSSAITPAAEAEKMKRDFWFDGDKEARASAGAKSLGASKAVRELSAADRLDAKDEATSLAFRGLGGEAPHRREELKKGFDKTRSRFIEGKTFYLTDGRWIDGEIQTQPSSKRVRLEIGSEEYFSLLKKHKQMAKWLSVGKNLELYFEGTIYEIAG